MIYIFITIIAFLFALIAYKYERLFARNNELLKNYNSQLKHELSIQTADLLKQKKNISNY